MPFSLFVMLFFQLSLNSVDGHGVNFRVIIFIEVGRVSTNAVLNE